MDSQRFDELTKALAKGTTRRGALKVLRGGLAGALLAAVGAREATAGSKGSRGRGRGVCAPAFGTCTGEECCGSLPCLSSDAGTICCPPGHVCGDACCPDGHTCCDGQCIPKGACCTHTDCDDGNACTVDLCGPTSHQCTNVPISGDCVQCASDAHCSGGSCCHGRCCPAGAGCQLSATGEPICCPDCDGHVCCDTITYSTYCPPGGDCYVKYQIAAARCHYGEGNCASCPAFCTVYSFAYVEGETGTGTCGPENRCGPTQVAPLGRFS